MGPLWTRLAVDLAQRFDGITVANRPLQERYGGTVIPHARDPEQLKPATEEQKAAARQRFGVPPAAKVILFFGTPKRHKGILELARAVAQLPDGLQPLLVVAGAFAREDAGLQAARTVERAALQGGADRFSSRSLAAIVHTCLAERPEHRYATAVEVTAELDRWLAGEPVLARPPTWLERAGGATSGARRAESLTSDAAMVTRRYSARERTSWKPSRRQRTNSATSVTAAVSMFTPMQHMPS
jgi:hypothetical protein